MGHGGCARPLRACSLRRCRANLSRFARTLGAAERTPLECSLAASGSPRSRLALGCPRSHRWIGSELGTSAWASRGRGSSGLSLLGPRLGVARRLRSRGSMQTSRCCPQWGLRYSRARSGRRSLRRTPSAGPDGRMRARVRCRSTVVQAPPSSAPLDGRMRPDRPEEDFDLELSELVAENYELRLVGTAVFENDERAFARTCAGWVATIGAWYLRPTERGRHCGSGADALLSRWMGSASPGGQRRQTVTPSGGQPVSPSKKLAHRHKRASGLWAAVRGPLSTTDGARAAERVAVDDPRIHGQLRTPSR